MNAVTYFQINFIPMIALIMMWMNTKRTLSFSWRNRALRFIMLLMAILLGTNAAARMLDGRRMIGAKLWLGLCNMAYLAIMVFIAFLWLLYVYDILENGDGQRGKRVLLPALPALAILLMILINPWTHWLFYIDAQNPYMRGKLFFVSAAVGIFYLVVASGLALIHFIKETVPEKKREDWCLAFAALLPLVGGILQIYFPRVELVWPLTVASLLMVYLNIQKDQVTQDGLTGLNNRRRLDQYLAELQERSCDGEACYFILLDVDKFKKVNDTCGHVAGDMVLKLVAEQLKRTFGSMRAFLARYGGDEFVIIIRGSEEHEVEEKIRELKEGVAGLNWIENRPWELSISVGCAQYGECGVVEVNELIKLADARMYEQKRGIRKAESGHTTTDIA